MAKVLVPVMQPLKQIEMAVQALDEAIHKMELQRAALIAMLPKGGRRDEITSFSHPITGKKVEVKKVRA